MVKGRQRDIRNITRDGLEEWAASQGLQPFRGRQIFKWIWSRRPAGFNDFSDISKELRAKLQRSFFLYDLNPISRQESRDGTIKWGFELEDGNIIETVLIPEKDHNTLCISTQAGCALGCRFCMTARMGLRRGLKASEIAGQALSVIREVPKWKRPRNIVFMGMGEPLANFGQLIRAIEILTDDLGLNFSNRRITVSTSGIVPKILELGYRMDVGLAISLHATTDQVRSELMPINRRYPLQHLLEACRRYNLAKRRRITFEYLMLRGVNDLQEDAHRLTKLLNGIPSKVNLIPFNECPDLPFQPSEEKNILRFQEILKQANLTTIIRKSKGQDIMAACGQLNSHIKKRGRMREETLYL